MRIAFAANPALGHVLPLVPLALAARDAGHDVCFLAGASVAPTLGGFALPHVAAGLPDLATMFDAIDADRFDGPRRVVRVWAQGFADVLARPLAAGLLDLAATWRPDLVVHEDTEQGTWIAAEALGIPHITLQAAAWRGNVTRLSAEPSGRLRAELGLSADGALASWHRYGYLTTRPASLRDPADPMPAGTTELRPDAPEDDGSTSAPWLDARPQGRARIAVTLGTVAPDRRAPLLATILDGLAPLDAEIVVALGPGLDPNAFLPRSANVRLVSFVPMARLMSASDLVVCHAGSGTVLAGLAAGRPLVLLPMAADQPANADACAAAGAALVLGSESRTPAAIRAAVRHALDDGALARAATRVRDEIAAMPPPAAVVGRLERLVGAA